MLKNDALVETKTRYIVFTENSNLYSFLFLGGIFLFLMEGAKDREFEEEEEEK